MATTQHADPASSLEKARALAARGWRPFPLDHPSLPVCAGSGRKCRENREKYGDCKPKDRGKHPVNVWSTQTASAPTDQMLAIWFGEEVRNIGLAAGPSGLLIIDEDTHDALTALAADQGEELPDTYRVLTSRGWHWYFLDPDNEFGNSAGALEEYGCDVRGGHGHGGYVVAAGSTHHTGVEYVAEDDHAEVAPLPEWIKTLLRTPAASKKVDSEQSEHEGPWTDEPRYGYPDELRGQYRRHLAAVRALVPAPGRKPNGEAFRHRLFLAARDGWRLVHCGLANEIEMLNEIRSAIETVWSAPPDDDDRHIVYTEAQQKAIASPWRALDPGVPPPASSGADGGVDAVDPEIEHKAAVRTQLARLRALREAEQLLASENRAPLSRLSYKEFLAAPAPEYLVPQMFYRDGLAVVFGAPGAAKSFLVLDIALCLATGTSWRGHPIGRGRVHYVMAEGQATNTLRAQAWHHHRDVDADLAEDWFVPYTEPIMLTDAGVNEYLQQVKADEPDMIILDTKNLMFEGKESQGDDYGAMLRVLHKIRRTANGCAVVLIDHSGLVDDSRTRGSNAQKGGVETEIQVTEERGGVRRARVTRDKSGMIGTEWFYKLVQVDDVPRPADVTPPAVCVAVDANEALTLAPFGIDENWNDPAQPELPADVAGYTKAGRAAIRALARFMRYSATGSVGFSQAAARRAVQSTYVDERGKPKWSPDTIDRAWQALVDLGRLDPATNSGEPTGRSTWHKRPDDPEWPLSREMT